MRCALQLFSLMAFIFMLPGCGDDAFVNNDDMDMEENSPKVSQAGATVSHTDNRRGSNCMDCHYEGNNQYIYTVAGTVYRANDITQVYPNAVVKFYTEADGGGDYIGAVYSDAYGNFYTTEPMDLMPFAYPVVEGPNGDGRHTMNNFITHGACNSCHGENELPIYAG